ncbi:MAG: exodeoxyribonuclease VII small subunit [Flavobacteriales bacterium]|jgi:exodeoxyribonuclease VII small subunit
MAKKAPITYEAAALELEEILGQLENDEISVDVLAEKVERASVLLKMCSERLRSTEKRVDEIIENLGL